MTQPLSRTLWDLDFREHLPRSLGEGVELRAGTLDDVLAFTSAHYAAIFHADATDTRFVPERLTEAKRRFLAASDKLLFCEGDEVIGILVGNPIDWSTYYWRTVAFLPEHQGRGLLAAALEHTDELMRHVGIARIEGEAAPANYRQVRLLLRLGYCITGSTNSERWGALLRLTKFLDPEGHRVFTTQFCKDQKLPGPPGRQHEPQRQQQGGHDEEVRDRLHLSAAPSSSSSRVLQ